MEGYRNRDPVAFLRTAVRRQAALQFVVCFFMLFCYAKFDFNVLANALNNCVRKRGEGKGKKRDKDSKAEGQREDCVRGRAVSACVLIVWLQNNLSYAVKRLGIDREIGREGKRRKKREREE